MPCLALLIAGVAGGQFGPGGSRFEMCLQEGMSRVMLTGLMTVMVGTLTLAAPSKAQAATSIEASAASGSSVVETAEKQPSMAVQMIPTPGAAGLIALGGLAMLRRKRETK